MKIERFTGIVLVSCVVAGWSTEAAAQAPLLTMTTDGARVVGSWTHVPGATFYVVEATSGGQVMHVAIPALSFTVNPTPPGSYAVRVIATNGVQYSSWSNTVVITVGAGGGGCSPASIAAATNGSLVTFTWSGAQGATGYQLLAGTAPGRVDFVQPLPASTTTFQVRAPQPGTYYVRLQTHTACGTLTSSEIVVTVHSSSGGPCHIAAPRATWTSTQWRECFFSLVEQTGVGPNAALWKLSVLRPHLNALGADWQYNSAGELRPRLYMPTPHGGPLTNPPNWDQFVDVVYDGEPWPNCDCRPWRWVPYF